MLTQEQLRKEDDNVEYDNNNECKEYIQEFELKSVDRELLKPNTKTCCQEEIDLFVSPFQSLFNDDDNQAQVFVPVDMHQYDEDDYRDHRHRTYPHVHQPLRSMEPRVLMEIKTRIKACKRAKEKAATAGVLSIVPVLLAGTSDTRVLIDSSGVVSVPVRDSELSEKPLYARKKRKRKRRRSKKKQDSFQPTLCKLSEESSSPRHSAVADDGEEHRFGGIVLQELSDVMRSLYDSLSISVGADQSVTSMTDSDQSVAMSSEMSRDAVNIAHNAVQQYSLSFLEHPPHLFDLHGSNEHHDEHYPDLNNEYFDPLRDNATTVSDTHTLHISTTEMCAECVDDLSEVCSTEDSVCPSYDYHHHPYHNNHHHHHHHHHHRREHYDKRDLEQRRFSGEDMRSLWQSKETDNVEQYDFSLGDAMIEDIKNHRCEEMPALNHTHIRNRYLHMNTYQRTLQGSRSGTSEYNEDASEESVVNIEAEEHRCETT